VRAAGLGEVLVYLQDFDREVLMPLRPATWPPLSHATIEGPGLGAAFRGDTVVQRSGPTGLTMWAPIRNGGERVGVLALTVPGYGAEADAELVETILQLARLVAALLVLQDAYSDALFLARRRKPMTLAAEMHWQFLPPMSMQGPRVALAAMLSPAYEVGGDFFDYALNGDTLHFAIFDAVGHGLRAAILATTVAGAYRHARRNGADLRESYALIDDVIQVQFDDEDFATGQLAELDLSSGVLRWANAGHPSPLLVRNGRVVRSLDSEPTLPAGLGGSAPQVTEEQLELGDRVVFFTDGVIEERTPAGLEVGEEGLVRCLEQVEKSGLPVAETVRRLGHRLVADHAGTPTDDSTVVLLEWRA
jgi:serine phosphatase RsbU (regulator of sigma subunit)